ncbi:MAG: hypothetical protein ACREJO_13665 [Phycisphaerales bacterium]
MRTYSDNELNEIIAELNSKQRSLQLGAVFAPQDMLEVDHGNMWIPLQHRAQLFLNAFNTSSARLRELPQTTFVWTCSNELTGVAAALRGEYFIFLPALLPQLLGALIHDAFSMRTFFDWIGSASVESDDATLGPREYYLGDPFSGDHKSLMPIDRVRRVVANIITQWAFDFVVRHEMRHIIAGHLDYLAYRGLQACIVDGVGAPPIPVTALEWQALEMDADCFAVCGITRAALDLAESRDARLRSGIAPAHDVDEALSLLMFAVSAAFLLLGTGKEAPVQWEDLTHPPADIRGLSARATMVTYLQKRCPDLFHAPRPKCALAYSGLTQLHLLLQRPSVNLDSHLERFDAARYYSKKLTTEWLRLEPHLVPFSYASFDDLSESRSEDDWPAEM